MKGEGLGLFTEKALLPKKRFMATGWKIFFLVLPASVITIVSITLFVFLKNFDAIQLNRFTVTIILAIILSLIGATIGQVLVQKIIENGANTKPAIYRGIKVGIIYSIGFSIVISGFLYPYFTFILYYSLFSFAMFSVMLLLYSLIWIITAAFWSAEKYQYPAAVYTIAYIFLFAIILVVHNIKPDYTLACYAGGIFILFILLAAGVKTIFDGNIENSSQAQSPGIRKTVLDNKAIILFQVLQILAIFVDKIIAWVWQGLPNWQLIISGSYTNASFLGLIPTFSVGGVIYFGAKTKALLTEIYQGTIFDINKRVQSYKNLYWKSLKITASSSLILLLLTITFAIAFTPYHETLVVICTIGAGSVFLMIIILNSTVLSLFGQTKVSLLALFCILSFELLSIFLIRFAIWYLALGFLTGSLIGFLFSQITLIKRFTSFEYSLFSHVTSGALTRKG